MVRENARARDFIYAMWIRICYETVEANEDWTLNVSYDNVQILYNRHR